MGSDTQPQALTNGSRDKTGLWQSRTIHTPAPLPLLLSKKWLCHHFGLVGPAGKTNTEALYKKVLTPDILQAVGLTADAVRSRSVRTFDRPTSMRLIEALGL